MLTAAIFAAGDNRHATPPPANAPRGRAYIDGGPLRQGDLVWDSSSGRWIRADNDWAGTDVRRFHRVSRKIS